jgi:hypothetical protein
VTHDACLPSALVRWVDGLQDGPLGEWTLLLVKGLQMWGFVISQALWMAMPFLGSGELADIAHALENEETMEALFVHLTDGGTAKGGVEGR